MYYKWNRKNIALSIEKILPKNRQLIKRKTQYDFLIQSTNQLITPHKKIKPHRSSHNKNSKKTIANILEATLVEFGIDRARYHDGDIEGTSIIRLFKTHDSYYEFYSKNIVGVWNCDYSTDLNNFVLYHLQ